jgi:hypothetical protein
MPAYDSVRPFVAYLDKSCDAFTRQADVVVLVQLSSCNLTVHSAEQANILQGFFVAVIADDMPDIFESTKLLLDQRCVVVIVL